MHKLILILILIIIFAGCTNEMPDTDMQSTILPSTETTYNTVQECPEPSEVANEPPIQDSLEILAGSYCDRFQSTDTDNYMDYWLHVPENATHGMPLIIFLHGKGEIGRIEALENYGMIQKAREIYGDNFPFIALSPCIHQKSWAYGDNPETLMALIHSIIEECEIDSDKIILTGHSLGSIGTWFLISEYGDFFSAAVPVSYGYNQALNYENIAKVPIWAFVGDADESKAQYADPMRQIIQKAQEMGGQGELTILTGKRHIETATAAYTEEVFSWMLSQ